MLFNLWTNFYLFFTPHREVFSPQWGDWNCRTTLDPRRKTSGTPRGIHGLCLWAKPVFDVYYKCVGSMERVAERDDDDHDDDDGGMVAVVDDGDGGGGGGGGGNDDSNDMWCFQWWQIVIFYSTLHLCVYTLMYKCNSIAVVSLWWQGGWWGSWWVC